MNMSDFDQEFDYVIVGAGSAGSVLASRLTEDPDTKVLVLEFGGKDNSILIQMPTAFSIPLGMKKYDWGLYSEPEAGLGGRKLHHARGKVIGGSSSINGMVYVRGSAGDYSEWQELGATNWGYADTLPYFQRAEDCIYGADTYRGDSGPLGVSNGNNMKNPLYRAFIEAGAQAGYGKSEDYNGYRQEGFSRMDMTVKNGVRSSTANAYLKPALKRANLKLEMHAFTQRVLFEGRKAIGVEYRRGGRIWRVRARAEVILSASAFNSPKLLMLSGIGPAKHLAEHGIEIVCDLPGVGANLQDHLEVWVQHKCTQKITLNGWLNLAAKGVIGAQWLFLKTGLGASNQFESNGYIRSRAGLQYPDIQYHFLAGAIAYDGSSAVKGHGFQVHLGANKPNSRGTVRLRSSDPEAPPVLAFNYLQDETDKQAFRSALHFTREIFAQPAFDPYRGEELSPGPEVQSDEDIDNWIRDTAATAYHPCGSCRMGTDDYAVVDPECRVRHVEGLRVVDSSVMPSLPSGNINAPTIMIAEKVADHILGRPMLQASSAAEGSAQDWETKQRIGSPERRLD